MVWLRGGAVAVQGRGAGSSERCEIGTCRLLGILADCLSQIYARAHVCAQFQEKLDSTSFESVMCAGNPGRNHVAIP